MGCLSSCCRCCQCCKCCKCCHCCKCCNKQKEPLLPLINEGTEGTINDGGTLPEIVYQIPPEIEQYPLNISMSKYINPNLENTNLFKNEYYRQDEQTSHAYFTKRSLVAWLHSEFDPERDAFYKEIHNADNMILSEKKDGSFLSSNIALIKMSFKIPKSDFPENTTVEIIASYTHGCNNRKKWDKGLKEYKMIEGDESNGILYSWMNAPIKLISERDIIEKKADFFVNGDFYSFASSTEDIIYEQVDQVTRILDFCSLAYIGIEDDYFVFKTLSQIDIKSNFAAMAKNLLPRKLKTWYNDMKNAINQNNAEAAGE